MARTRVVRTRLTPDEEAILLQDSEKAGISPSEFMRRLIIERRGVNERFMSLEGRVLHVESEVSKMWKAWGDSDA